VSFAFLRFHSGQVFAAKYLLKEFSMTRSDRWIAPFFFLFGFLVVLEASKLEFASSYGAGSGFFPFWLGVATIVSATIVTLYAWRNPSDDDSSAPIIWSIKKLLALAALLGFVFTLDLLGFVTGFALLVAFLLKLEGENWRRAVSVALASGLSFHLFFVRLLSVSLPVGPLGF
jgi:tripartite tricarboxylate transporter TctB family protein